MSRPFLSAFQRSNLASMLDSGEFSDLAVVVAASTASPPQTFHVHKAVLAHASEVFDGMIKFCDVDKDVVHLPNVSAKGFR